MNTGLHTGRIYAVEIKLIRKELCHTVHGVANHIAGNLQATVGV